MQDEDGSSDDDVDGDAALEEAIMQGGKMAQREHMQQLIIVMKPSNTNLHFWITPACSGVCSVAPRCTAACGSSGSSSQRVLYLGRTALAAFAAQLAGASCMLCSA